MNKLIQSFVIASALFLLLACGSIIQSQAASKIDAKKLTGHYIYGHEVNTFQPCGKKKIHWVTGSEETIQFLEKEYMKYSSQPYDKVFIEIVGNFIGKASDGFAMDYDGQILVTKILSVNKKSKSDCC